MIAPTTAFVWVLYFMEITEINGTKYVRFEYLGVNYNFSEKIANACQNDYQGILVKAKVNSYLFSKTLDLEVLIPENMALNFSNHKY